MKEELMKLVHYFVINQKYEAINIKGIKDEIWLQNFKNTFKIIRIVDKEINSKEELDKDIAKTLMLSKKIKRRTFSFSLPIQIIYLNIDKSLELPNINNLSIVNDKEKLNMFYPDLVEKTNFSEEGVKLINRITYDLNVHSKEVAKEYNDTFKKDTPYFTYFLILLNVLVYLFSLIDSSLINYFFASKLPIVKLDQYYRLVTYSSFHSPFDIFHLLFNMITLFWIGPIVEKYFGKVKYVFIYFLSAISGALLAIGLNTDLRFATVGASSAIFGLLGAIIYFAYNYKDRITASLLKQMTVIVVINLIFGFFQPNVDNFGHLGGLIGGIVTAMLLGTNKKRNIIEMFFSLIIFLGLYLILIYLGLFMVK